MWASMPKAQAAVDAEWQKLRDAGGGLGTWDESPVTNYWDAQRQAKEKLENIHSGHWDPDRRCPQTSSGGMVARRFMCQDKSEGKTYLARLIDLQGNKWRLQRGNEEELTPVEEERAEDDDPGTSPDDDKEEDDDGGAARRRGATAHRSARGRQRVTQYHGLVGSHQAAQLPDVQHAKR